MTTGDQARVGSEPGSVAPARAPIILGCLILVAAVANLNLAVANVALPDIGRHFDASQTQLNLVAVCYSLGLAASVLWFGAIGDRYGRKSMVLAGMALSIPACLIAAWASSIEILILARLLGGLSAGMAFPTTLALITALWAPGPTRTRAIALWSAIGGGFSALGPLAAGALLRDAWWGSVFLITLPLAAAALVLAFVYLPAHVNESDEPVDHLGGLLSVFAVGGLVLGINFAPVPDKLTAALVLLAGGAVVAVLFVLRQRRASNPLYDLQVAARPTFWVAAIGGIIVFGSLMGAMFIGQQYLQNVLGYSTVEAGFAILPAVLFMLIAAPRSAKLVASIGSRNTLLAGYIACLAGFVTMFVFWRDDANYAFVALGYALVGLGVGLAGTPASNSLTGSVPVQRVGMASGTADLQRDLGGAIMQSLLGALLTAGYARSFSEAIAGVPTSEQQQISDQVEQQLTSSFNSAEATAQQFPEYATQIVAAARESFVDGQDWAYFAGIVAIALGAVIIATRYPKHERELELLAAYRREAALTSVPGAR
jgi:DHA2 family multidrug resistance protein-like MFS transporter